jgi:predicted DCC family thiol-disulfide oxidoreductase YuxK
MEHAARTEVYYDGACPVCSREIATYRRAEGAEGLRFVDVSCPDATLAPDLTREDALARMHVRRADGSLVSGAAAFAALWSALPRWAWLGRIAALPVVAPLLELGYRGFLRVRRAWR